jgi:hypothetical protein
MTRSTITRISLVVVLVAQVANAQDYSQVKSGMLLGIYTSAGQGGMQVTSLIPGYSAQGRLQPGDVLLRVAVDERTMFRLRSLNELEDAKITIGPNREAALELWRPQVGLMYAWVEFTPIYAPASPAAESPVYATPAAPGRSAPMPAATSSRGNVRSGGQTKAAPAAEAIKSYAAQFKLESEKAGARAMFQKQPSVGPPVSGGNRSGGRAPSVGAPNRSTQPGNQSGNRSGSSAIDLFKEAKRLIDR